MCIHTKWTNPELVPLPHMPGGSSSSVKWGPSECTSLREVSNVELRAVVSNWWSIPRNWYLYFYLTKTRSIQCTEASVFPLPRYLTVQESKIAHAKLQLTRFLVLVLANRGLSLPFCHQQLSSFEAVVKLWLMTAYDNQTISSFPKLCTRKGGGH